MRGESAAMRKTWRRCEEALDFLNGGRTVAILFEPKETCDRCGAPATETFVLVDGHRYCMLCAVVVWKQTK